MPRIMAIGALSNAALGRAGVGLAGYPQDFGPWVQASDVDAALTTAAAQMQTGRDPSSPVAYKFLSNTQWTEEWYDTATSQVHTVDHVDNTGVSAPALRAAYEGILRSSNTPEAKAALGISSWGWTTWAGLGALGLAAAALTWWSMRRSRRRSRRR